jgi:hypothetical protein
VNTSISEDGCSSHFTAKQVVTFQLIVALLLSVAQRFDLINGCYYAELAEETSDELSS